MPSKKRKYNARFPAGRIKRIMQADEEVGKIAQAVPIIISRTLELFVESLLTKSSQITLSRNAKTLSPTHLKQCIMSESRFDFLKDLVKNIPDIAQDDSGSYNSTTTSNEEHHGSSSNGMNGSHRISLQRSQSLQMQPSTSSNSSQQHYHHTIASIPSATSSSSRVQQKQFFLNNYTTIPTQSNNNNNNNNDQNNTKINPNIAAADCSLSYQPPAKIFRINSTPAPATITSADQQKQPKKQSLAPLEFPIQISYNIDGSAASSTNSPTVKIDYSKLALPAAATTTTSPSIKIDLSHFNTQITPATASTSIQPSSNATTTMPTPSSSSSLCLDEDYDA